MAPSSGLAVRVSDEEEGTVVALAGAIDAGTSPVLREHLQELYEQGARQVVVDLGGVELIDSSGLGLLVAALKRYRESDGNIALRSPSHHVQKILDTTGLSSLFDVEA